MWMIFKTQYGLSTCNVCILGVEHADFLFLLTCSALVLCVVNLCRTLLTRAAAVIVVFFPHDILLPGTGGFRCGP
jgi:hypothetical protein